MLWTLDGYVANFGSRRLIRWIDANPADVSQTIASIHYGDTVALRVVRSAPASGAATTNPRWTTTLLSGTLPTAAQAIAELTQKMERDGQLGWALPSPAGGPVRWATTDGRILLIDQGKVIGTEAPQQSTSAWPREPGSDGQILASTQLQSIFAPLAVGASRCPVEALMGVWAGVQVTDRVQGIDVSFAFKLDGTYNYFAGEGNAPWISHSGVFQISDTGDQRYPCKISLTPDSATVEISSPAHLFVVQSRDLMDDKPRTFMYKFFPTAGHLICRHLD